MEKKIKVKLIKSKYGILQDQRNTLTALGLRRINAEREFADTPVVRGMIFKVKHLVQVTERECIKGDCDVS